MEIKKTVFVETCTVCGYQETIDVPECEVQEISDKTNFNTPDSQIRENLAHDKLVDKEGYPWLTIIGLERKVICPLCYNNLLHMYPYVTSDNEGYDTMETVYNHYKYWEKKKEEEE